MQNPADGAPRLLRALGLVALVLAIGALAHTLAGGHLPTAPVLAVLGLLLLPVAVLICGRQVRPLTAVLLLGTGQLVLHHAFALLAACGPAQLSAGAASGHLAHLGAAVLPDATATSCHAVIPHLAGTGTAGADVAGTGIDAPTVTGLPMLALHIAATLVTALLVAATARAVWLLARGLRPLLNRLLAALDAARSAAGGTLPRTRAAAPPVAAHLLPPRTRLAPSDAPRRGPPRPGLAGPAALRTAV